MNRQIAPAHPLKRYLMSNLYLFSALIVIAAFYFINPSFLSLYSIQNITLEIAPLLPMALGIAFVLYTGCIDLSVGAIASATCVITGLNVAQYGNMMIVYMLLMGAMAGLINGLLVARLRLPSFIVTLCAQSVWRAVAIVLSQGGSASIALKQRVIVNWASEKVLLFPLMFWISLLLVGVCLFIERKTELGKSIFVIGANEKAARLAGVNNVRIKVLAYVLCGVGAALSGILYAYKLKSSVPTIGDGLFMLSISAVALGGTLFSGGRGSALRTLVGVVTVISISSGMNMAGVDPLWKDVVFGLVLIFAVFFNAEKGSRDLMIK